MASIFGASKGIAPCCSACSSKSFSSTNRNSACGSTNRFISQGQATRSTFMSLRVIHFINTSRQIRFRYCKARGPHSVSQSVQNNSGCTSCENHDRLRHFLYAQQNSERHEPNQCRRHIEQRTSGQDIGGTCNCTDGSRGDSLHEGFHLPVLSE